MATALPALFIPRSQMRVLPPTPSRVLWSKQGKLFLEKNEREWKIQSHQYFTYAMTAGKELVNKAAAGCVCASHGWECWGCCRLAEAAAREQQLPLKTPDWPNQAMCTWEKLECHTRAPPELQLTPGFCLVRLVTSQGQE